MVAYSGGFQPLLRAIEQRGYKVHTIVAIGAPTLMDRQIPDEVKRIVYVAGDRDSIPLVNRFVSLENRHPVFTHRGETAENTTVETINLRLTNSAINPDTRKSRGVNHTQYFIPNAPDPQDPGSYRYVAATHQLITDLIVSSQLGQDPIALLRSKHATDLSASNPSSKGSLELDIRALVE